MAGPTVLKSIPNARLFWETFYGNFISHSDFLPEFCWEEIAEKIFFVFRFWCLAWNSNPSYSSNKPTHYLLDHDDFNPLTGITIYFSITLMLCAPFLSMNGGTYSLKSFPKYGFLRNSSWQFYLLSEFSPEANWRGTRT